MEWDPGISLTRWFLVTSEFENFSFKHLETQLSYLTPNFWTKAHAKAYNYSKMISCSLTRWYWQIWTTNISPASSEALSSLPCPSWNSGDHFGWNSGQRILSQFSYKHINTASVRRINWYIWASYFEYFARWVVGRDWIVVHFWKVDPRTKGRSLSDSAPPLCIPLCGILPRTIKDTCHSTAALFCWHSQSHFFFSTAVRALHTLRIPSGDLILTFHEAEEACTWTKGSEDSWPPKDQG